VCASVCVRVCVCSCSGFKTGKESFCIEHETCLSLQSLTFVRVRCVCARTCVYVCVCSGFKTGKGKALQIEADRMLDAKTLFGGLIDKLQAVAMLGVPAESLVPEGNQGGYSFFDGAGELLHKETQHSASSVAKIEQEGLGTHDDELTYLNPFFLPPSISFCQDYPKGLPLTSLLFQKAVHKEEKR